MPDEDFHKDGPPKYEVVEKEEGKSQEDLAFRQSLVSFLSRHGQGTAPSERTADGRVICRQYQQPGGCRWKECRYAHIDKKGDLVVEKKEEEPETKQKDKKEQEQ